MTLKDTIKDDMKTAFKAGDTVTRGTLSLLLSVVQNRELEKRSKGKEPVLTDEEVTDAISSEVKKRRDSIAQYESAARPELAASEKAEMDVLMRYMPTQMSEDEVKAIISVAIAATGAAGAKDIGKVMAKVAPQTKGKFDGNRVNTLVKETLGA